MIVQIPKDIYSYEHKAVGNLTKRQAVCGGIGIVIAFSVFIPVFQKTGDSMPAAFLSMMAVLPVLACCIVKKDGQYWDQILRHRFRQKFRYPRKRKFIMHNLYEIMEQNNKEYEAANEKKNAAEPEKEEGRFKALFALGEKKDRPGQHSV